MNLNQLTIRVSNLEQSLAFYELLGLTLIVKDTLYARFECPTGDATFSIHQEGTVAKDAGAWIYFEVDDVDDKIRELIRKGISIEAIPEDKPWLWREARLLDPDNNWIIVYHAGQNRKNPPWRIN